MNIDFHHTVTYLVGRVAGLDDSSARTVAHAAQYVDDATDEGLVVFDNGAMYRRLATAHRALDYKNFAALANRLVWIPFHFLPGNGGLESDQDPSGKFIQKLITLPDSPVAREMIRLAILEQDRPYALHRLGIVAHVYVDTWAHQGFAGVNHRVNQVRDVRREGQIDEHFRQKMWRFFHGVVQQNMPPIGHGAAFSYPDKPYLKWSYTNGLDQQVVRDNTEEFIKAADSLCRMFRRYLIRDPEAKVNGLPEDTKAAIRSRLEDYRDSDERIRHRRWQEDLRSDAFGIGSVELPYVGKGPGSWRDAALSYPAPDTRDRRFPYDDAFLTSDWKLFHDAAKAHRRSVVDDVLPSFGICVA
ncbi:MAG: DUF6765 family protein [Myxococcota bacterium]